MSALNAGLDRVRRLLARPGAWIHPHPDGGYALRCGPDRRSRIEARLDEATFGALIVSPGLATRPGGGWTPRRVRQTAEAPEPGRPGQVEGERLVLDAKGRLVGRRANLGESPIAWLARRKDSAGRPWLTPAEAAAGERLRQDSERAAAGPPLTMRWDALPRAGGGSSARVEPGDRALTASARVSGALKCLAPRARSFVAHICLNGSSLQLAEQEMGLGRRQGRDLLKQGLGALAAHYGIGPTD